MNHLGARDLIQRHIPVGYALPARFDDFLRAHPPVEVTWTDLEDYDLRASASETAVPFLRLSDGGLVAFWYEQLSPAIVHIGGHGELRVVAHDFDDFLMAVAARRTGLSEFDEARLALSVPGVEGNPEQAGLAELQRKLERWFSENTSLLEPLRTPSAEALRQRVYAIARAMVGDGLSKVYSLSSPWWSMDFHIERTGKGVSMTYRDYGKWYPVPGKYELAEEVAALLELVVHRERSRYELSVCSAGIVSIERDRELVIVPPER